jgi:predicted nuclease with RNAse H fold
MLEVHPRSGQRSGASSICSGSYTRTVITVGVDLAAEPAGTAVAAVEWAAGRATIRNLYRGATDAQVLASIREADRVGIDCPLGWPRAFVEFLTSHSAGSITVPAGITGLAWRDELAYRSTDRAVRRVTGIVPLSVSSDRIGRTAMRCASLLAQMSAEGRTVDRTGAGLVAEVYPAASLQRWAFTCRGYKGTKNAPTRSGLVDALLQQAPWLSLRPHEALCRASDDALDAVIAALTARAVAMGQTVEPSSVERRAAASEGWIHIPSESLAGLTGPGCAAGPLSGEVFPLHPAAPETGAK